MHHEKTLSADDFHYFSEGRHFNIYEKMGAQLCDNGVSFTVWAPNAGSVSVIGDFNGWNKTAFFLSSTPYSGIWSGFLPEAKRGERYKYHIVSNISGYEAEKADPVGFFMEQAPRTASVISDLDYSWSDADWMDSRQQRQSHDCPISIYEIHIGSWRRMAEDHNRPLTYQELGDALIPYLQETGFTHVEFMPVMEHPFGGSWGYQITGYFAPTSRYGSPQDFMALINRLHQAGFGVFLDWVPSHFPGDAHGLACFDGTNLYEHADPQQGIHPDWNSCIFNYGRPEVRSFLISNAMFWLDKYHIDGLRVDAVASLLYLDYSRKPGEWAPNIHGGRVNLEAVHFIKELNEAVYARFPGIQMMAEESTAWPGVSRPVFMGGLGFGLKWDMGWMNDTVRYFQNLPVYRKHHQTDLTFRSVYAHDENFVLALSHDEVVHGKRALLAKMPGDDWQKFANLRCLYAYMFSLPGKKLLFMGSELAPWKEWSHDNSLDWHLLDSAPHQQIKALVSDLNRLYRTETAFHIDCDPSGYQMIDGSDAQHSVMGYLRKNSQSGSYILCVFNFTPVPRHDYHIGVPCAGPWLEILNSDAALYGGSNHIQPGPVQAERCAMHGQEFSLSLLLPPLGGVFLKWMP